MTVDPPVLACAQCGAALEKRHRVTCPLVKRNLHYKELPHEVDQKECRAWSPPVDPKPVKVKR